MFAGGCVRLCALWSRVVPGSRGWWTLNANRGANTRRLHIADLYKNESVQKFLRLLVDEHRHLSDRLQHQHLSDPDRRELTRRLSELQPVTQMFDREKESVEELEELLSLLQDSAGAKDEDEHLTRLLKEEEAQMSRALLDLRRKMVEALVPHDPLDCNDVLLEVVSGRTTGGDICQQFTKEMFDMYQGFAFYKEWDFEVLNYTSADYGGLHHAAVRIAGEDVHRRLKHEVGTHRVQRIPEVGLSSRMQRIHTGTTNVIVLPQPAELDVHIDPKDLRVDTFKSRGPGGQAVNTTDSAVRIVHLPTGMAAECQQSRSQLRNRDAAMRVLRARLYQSMMGKELQQRHAVRKQQLDLHSRSERIRTYNFSQDRVTDHRTGYTARDIKGFMAGGEALDDLIGDVLGHTEAEALLEAVGSYEGAPC